MGKHTANAQAARELCVERHDGSEDCGMLAVVVYACRYSISQASLLWPRCMSIARKFNGVYGIYIREKEKEERRAKNPGKQKTVKGQLSSQ